MSKYLLLLSIGPVQEFISAARRCRDLWYGSWLLSELATAAARGVDARESGGPGTLIFPGSLVSKAEGNAPGAPSVANKLLVEVNGDATDVRALADAAREAMNERLTELRDRAFGKLDGAPAWDRELATRHVDEMMELEWVAVPWDGSYKAARSRAEELLAGRKNAKIWQQSSLVGDPKGGRPKSALDGQRESVIFEDPEDDTYRNGESPFFDTSVARRAAVKDREHLCGVGVLKRYGVDADGDEVPVFHSTSHMASAPLRARIAAAGSAGERALDAYLNWLEAEVRIRHFRIRACARHNERNEGVWTCAAYPGESVQRVLAMDEHGHGYDGLLLYPNRLHEVYEAAREGDEKRSVETFVEEGTQKLKALFRAVGAPSEPPAYYAMILADGDRMGVAIDALEDPDAHRGFSQNLADQFAGHCGACVEQHGGSLIYAGGDDVLALVPVTNALACADDLRELFEDAMKAAIPDAALEPGTSRPTLSVGVAIAHHMEPMDDVRKLAGRAEKLAKVERNSLAVVLSKRGGGEIEVTGTWPSGIKARLEELAGYFRDGALSNKTPYDLHETLAPLEVSDTEWDAEALDPVVRSLMKRVLARKDASDVVRARIEALIEERLAKTSDEVAPGKGALTRAQSLANELRLALELKDWIVEQEQPAPSAPGETAA